MPEVQHQFHTIPRLIKKPSFFGLLAKSPVMMLVLADYLSAPFCLREVSCSQLHVTSLLIKPLAHIAVILWENLNVVLEVLDSTDPGMQLSVFR